LREFKSLLNDSTDLACVYRKLKYFSDLFWQVCSYGGLYPGLIFVLIIFDWFWTFDFLYMYVSTYSFLFCMLIFFNSFISYRCYVFKFTFCGTVSAFVLLYTKNFFFGYYNKGICSLTAGALEHLLLLVDEGGSLTLAFWTLDVL